MLLSILASAKSEKLFIVDDKSLRSTSHGAEIFRHLRRPEFSFVNLPIAALRTLVSGDRISSVKA